MVRCFNVCGFMVLIDGLPEFGPDPLVQFVDPARHNERQEAREKQPGQPLVRIGPQRVEN